MLVLAAFSGPRPAGAVVALKVVFSLLEILIIAAGIYVFRQRRKLFGFKEAEGDTYASANLRLAMVVLIWIHAVVVTAILIFEI